MTKKNRDCISEFHFIGEFSKKMIYFVVLKKRHRKKHRNMPRNAELIEKQDCELVQRLIGGSQAAFAELYVRYKDVLRYACQQFLNDDTEAEDIVQDIFMQVWEKRDALNAELSFSGYIHTLARNRILNIFRQSSVHARYAQYVLANEQDLTNETEDLILDNDYAALLNEIMNNLSYRQREVFRLSRIEGMKYHEIAEKLQVSIPAIQQHASIALKKIKGQLKKHASINFQIL